MPRPAVGGDDQVDPRRPSPATPCRVGRAWGASPSARIRATIGPCYAVRAGRHVRSPVSVRPGRSDARLRPVPETPVHPVDPARPGRRRPEGRDARGRDLRRVDPHRGRGRGGRSASSSPDRQVAGLRGAGRDRSGAARLPRRRAQPGRPRASGRGDRGDRPPARVRAGGPRPDRVRHRRHPAHRSSSGRSA